MKTAMRISMVACVAVTTVLALAACSTEDTSNYAELKLRGFTHITTEQSGDDGAGGITTGGGIYFANAGGCRVVLSWDPTRVIGDEWMLVENSSKGTAYDLVLPNPTVAKIGQLPNYASCINVDTQSTKSK